MFAQPSQNNAPFLDQSPLLRNDESEEGSTTSIEVVDIVEKSEREIQRVMERYNE